MTRDARASPEPGRSGRSNPPAAARQRRSSGSACLSLITPTIPSRVFCRGIFYLIGTIQLCADTVVLGRFFHGRARLLPVDVYVNVPTGDPCLADRQLPTDQHRPWLPRPSLLSSGLGGGGGGAGGGALGERHVGALGRTGVDLPRAADLAVRILVHLLPVGDPPGDAAEAEHDRVHVDRDADRLVEDAAVEVD